MTAFVVTGAGGQVGREVCRLLRESDVDFAGLTHQELNIASADDVAAAVAHHQPRVLINCAAYNAVDDAEQESELALTINANGPGYLAHVCREHGAALVHFSTDYVFDGAARRPYVETDLVGPLGVYGRSKREGEVEVLESGCVGLVLRVSWVFGRIGRGFVDSVLRWATGGSLKVVDDQCSVPCDAVELARFAISAGSRVIEEPSLSGLYHYAMGPPVTRHAYACEIISLAADLGIVNDVDVEAVSSASFDTPAQRPPYSVLSCERLMASFAPDPSDWRDGLKAYLRSMSG